MSEYRNTTADKIIKSRRLNDKLTSGTLASAGEILEEKKIKDLDIAVKKLNYMKD
jgi:hypothetical protein